MAAFGERKFGAQAASSVPQSLAQVIVAAKRGEKASDEQVLKYVLSRWITSVVGFSFVAVFFGARYGRCTHSPYSLDGFFFQKPTDTGRNVPTQTRCEAHRKEQESNHRVAHRPQGTAPLRSIGRLYVYCLVDKRNSVSLTAFHASSTDSVECLKNLAVDEVSVEELIDEGSLEVCSVACFERVTPIPDPAFSLVLLLRPCVTC